MVNCNPETVSTDYDTSDRLYFEPLTLEDVLEIVHAESLAGPDRRCHRPARRPDPAGPGPGAQGQRRAGRRHLARRRSTPPRTAAPSAGSSPRPACPAPKHGTATTFAEAKAIADEIGYPVLVRPSYVLGGRGMEIVYDETRLASYIAESTEISPDPPGPGRPLPRRRDRDRRRRPLRRPRALPRRRHGAHRGGRHPLRRLRLRAAPDHPRRLRHQAAARLHRGHRQGRRRPRPDQHPVRAGRRHPLRAGGQPARLPHRPLHLEGDRGPARQGRRPHLARRHRRRAARRGPAAEDRRRRHPAAGRADLRQGGGHAVVAVPRHPRPRRRHRPRPGDALHRRGHGHRLRLRHGVRQVAGRRLRRRCPPRAARSSRSPTATSAR